MICSPRWLLPAIQSPTKNKFPTTGCLSTRQFKSVQQIRRRLIQRTRLPKLQFCLPQHTTCRHRIIWYPPTSPCRLHSISVLSYSCLAALLSLPALLLITCLQLQTTVACNFKPLEDCGIPAINKPAIMHVASIVLQ